MKQIVILILCLLGTYVLQAQLRAFPEAEGYGAYTTGGRGGRVFYVTHTRDTACDRGTAEGNAACKELPLYKGSFREALAQDGPVTIVFKCGGTIALQATQSGTIKQLKSGKSNVTIAGQTALGDGICLKDYGVGFSGQNNIIRHIRSRPGFGGDPNSGQSCLWYENGGQFIIDHCSFSWATEESNTIYDNTLSTVQYCLVSESLYDGKHKKGVRGYGAQWGGNTASYHHNLLAHHMSRMPRQNGARSLTDARSTFDYRNNVHYNWGSDGAFYGGDVETSRGGEWVHSNLINNYFVPGPSTTANESNQAFVSPSGSAVYAKWHLDGNIMKHNDAKTNNQKSGIRGQSDSDPAKNFYTATIYTIPTSPNDYTINTQRADSAYANVLANVGAMPWQRDSIDRRIVREVATETYTYTGSRSTNTAKNKGIIDDQWDIMPHGEDTTTWDPWYSHYREVALIGAPDTFEVKTFVGGEWKTEIIKMSRTVDSDNDGMPDWWEQANGLGRNNPADGATPSASGYTNLEVYLNSFPYANAPADEVISTWRSIEPLPCDTCDVDCDTCDINTGVAFKGEIQPHLRIYPNPVATDFHIETVLEPKLVELYNLQGQRAASFPATTHSSYSVALLHKGVYFVKVTFANGKFATQRIVK